MSVYQNPAPECDGANILESLKESLRNASRVTPCLQQELVSFCESMNSNLKPKVSLLQLQTGVFRLLQGAAYRVYTVKYSLNCHTHREVKVLPYTWKNFVSYVEEIMELYRALLVCGGVLTTNQDGGKDSKSHLAITQLISSVKEQDAKLGEFIAHFDETNLTPEQLRCHNEIVETRTKSLEVKENFVDIAERALFQKKVPDTRKGAEGIALATQRLVRLHMRADAVAKHKGDVDRNTFRSLAAAQLHKERAETEHPATSDERFSLQLLTEQRRLAGYQEGFSSEKLGAGSREEGLQFKNEYRPVILERFDETVDGAMLPIRFWYDVFTPALLAACSVGMEREPDQVPGDAAWYLAARQRGEFDRWGTDVLAGWERLTAKEARQVRLAWRLTCRYLNGPEKLRERGTESDADHRATGELSQYVAFLDVPLQRSYVRDQNMRVSFPYFLGTATWVWKHSAAEIICAAPPTAQTGLVERFKSYMRKFVTMYPCPYCRHHLSAYVIVGRERELYPVEYLFLGWNPAGGGDLAGKVSVEDKLRTVQDGETLRLFLWKLHNSVNSSIARAEDWFHLEDDVIATSRYWPNIDAMCFKASAMGTGLVSAKKVSSVMSVLKICTKLLALRQKVLHMHIDDIQNVSEHILELIKLLDKRIIESGYLQQTYHFDPTYIDAVPVVDEILESSIRNQDFTLD